MALGAIITGATGNVSIPLAALQFETAPTDVQAVNVRIVRWTMSIARAEHDTTTFGLSTNFRSFVGGVANFIGRCEGYLDSTHFIDMSKLETEDVSATAGFVLKASEQGTTDRSYTFSALISGLDLGIDKGGHSSLSFNFRGSLTDATVDFVIGVDQA
ncbi:hypothetical protein LCGC14_1416170 [marine sediment metagenome]|uniref:Uncharacterized protein n=1 Tax=marine sediment metagenome TaxID=412755 RepID=A0A0F9JT64_9ZZZZ